MEMPCQSEYTLRIFTVTTKRTFQNPYVFSVPTSQHVRPTDTHLTHSSSYHQSFTQNPSFWKMHLPRDGFCKHTPCSCLALFFILELRNRGYIWQSPVSLIVFCLLSLEDTSLDGELSLVHEL